MVKRELYLKRIRSFYESDLIKVITGIRRCGKSVLLKQIMDEMKEDHGVTDDHIIYMNLEDMKYAFVKNAMDLYGYVEKLIVDEEKYYIFLDEIQMVEEFERAINSFHATKNVSIFITGSNSRLLSGEMATLLTGRYVSFRVMPFRFQEMCEMLGVKKEEASEKEFMDYITWGGMPQRFYFKTEEETKVFMTDLYDSIVLKDIFWRGQVRDVDALNRLLEYIVLNPSQTFSPTSIAKYFESVNRKVAPDTIYNYMEKIVAAMVMNKAMRYDIRGKRVLTRFDKYYLTDVGFGKIKNTGFKTEIGALIENVVYNELLVRGYEVYVGKTTKGEIDFVAVKDGKKEYYQVAYLLATEDVIEREFGAYKDIQDNYPKYVLSMDRFDFSRDGIIHQNVIDFLMER